MKNIPNFFTLLNLVFGCLAIIFTLQQNILLLPLDGDGNIVYNHAQFQQLSNTPEKIWLASLFIGLAAVVDFADGFIARLLRTEGAMGKQLDSLADMVSFGVAPGLIIWYFLRLSFAQQSGGLDITLLSLLPALVLPCAAAWRLAKFNLDSSQAFSFKGLPVPAVGMLIASFPLIYWNIDAQWVSSLFRNSWFLYAITLLCSWLMVSNLPMMALKFKDFSIQNNLPKYLLAVIAVAAVLLLKWLAIPAIILAYVILSLLFKTKSA